MFVYFCFASDPAVSTCDARVYVGFIVLLSTVIVGLTAAIVVFIIVKYKCTMKTPANDNIETPGNTSMPIPSSDKSKRFVMEDMETPDGKIRRKIVFEAEQTLTRNEDDSMAEGRMPSPNTVNNCINSIFTPRTHSEPSSGKPSPSDDPSPTSNTFE